MLVNCAFPGVEERLVVALLLIDAPLVFNLSKFGSSFFVHFILQVTAHSPITFSNLSKDVSLVCLFGQCGLHCLFFMSNGLPHDLGFILLQFIVLQPVSFLLQFSFSENILLTVLIYILHQVDTSLVLTAPLGLLCLPLLDVFVLNQLVDHLLVFSFILSLLAIVLLELNDLFSACIFYSLLKISDCFFFCHRSC